MKGLTVNRSASDQSAGAPDTLPPTSVTSYRLLLSMLLVFAATFAVFLPAINLGFVDWDDDQYVLRQPHVLNGLSPAGLKWAATARVAGNWHPLTLVSLQLDAQSGGGGSDPNPRYFHRTSVFLHSLNAALALLVLNRLTGSFFRSLIVTLLFAVHPTRVESTAWISERKDVLSGMFFLLTILTYIYYVRKPSVSGYLIVLFLFFSGLMSKSMLVTTPAVLLLLDFWPLSRLSATDPIWHKNLQRAIAEKIPMILLAVLTSVVTLKYQADALDQLDQYPVTGRLKNAVWSLVVYLAQTFWPSGLSPYYGLREIPTEKAFLALFITAGLTIIAIRQRKDRPWLLTGWFWYCGMLIPVSGIIQAGTQARADRYLYLPHLGLFLMLVWNADPVMRWLARRHHRWIGSVLAITVLFGFAAQAQALIPVWQNTESLWRRAFTIDPRDSLVIQPNLIRCLIRQGRASEALDLTKECLRTSNQSDPRAIVWLANLLAVQNEHTQCIEALTAAMKTFPDDHRLAVYRGKAYASLGNWQAAAHDFRQAASQYPDSPSCLCHLAQALSETGQAADAEKLYARVRRDFPSWPNSAAAEVWQRSTSFDPNQRLDRWPVCLAQQIIQCTKQRWPPYLDVLAAAHANAGQFDMAVSVTQEAIRTAERDGQHQFAEDLRRKLKTYQAQQPFRQTAPPWFSRI